MKTNKILLPGMLATMAFAACTNEDVIPQQGVGELKQDLSNRPVVGIVDLNIGSQSETRAEMGENFNDIVWTSVDKIGARIMDTRNTSGLKDCHAAHNYTVGEYAWSNYRYDFNNGVWSSDALMVEGNYMFYAPYDQAALYRTELEMKFPTAQKVKGLTAIAKYNEGGIGGNTSAIENFYANKEGQTVVVGHTFLDSKDNDGTKVSPQMTHLYAYPLITLVNDYTEPVMVKNEETGELEQKIENGIGVVEGKSITIDRITIESSNIYTKYTINQPNLAAALSLDVEKVDLNGDGDTADKNECAGITYSKNWASEGVKSGWFLRNAFTANIADAIDTKVDVSKNEVDPDGKIVVELDEPLTIPAGYGVKFNVVMPAAEYANDNFKVNVRIVAEEDGETVYKKFDQNAFFFNGDGISADEFKYAVSKQIPAEEYNFKSDGTTAAKKSWGTLATFHLNGDLIDYEAEIIDPVGIKNNAQFYAWLDDVADNSTSKFEKEFDNAGKEIKVDINGDGDNTDKEDRYGDFRLASDHVVEFNADFVAKVTEYLNDEEAKIYFVSPLNVVGSDDAEKPLVISGAKYPKFGKLTIKSGYVKLDGVQVAELVVEGGNVEMAGSTSVGKVTEINGNVTLNGATLTAADAAKGITFKGTANLTNVTIKGGKAIFNETATIDGGSYGDVEFKKDVTLKGTITTTDGSKALVSGGTATAECAKAWATVELFGGNMTINNKNYAPTVAIGKAKEGKMTADADGKLTANAEGLALPAVTLNTASSKLIISQDATIATGKFTWTKGAVENSAAFDYALTVADGNSYTHDTEATITSLTNNGTVYNKGKLTLTNNKLVEVGTGGFTKTDIVGGNGRINNTALGYVTGTTANQVIYVKTGAFTNDGAWKDMEITNSKVNTLYIDGLWTINKPVTAGAFNYEFAGSGIALGAATVDFAAAKSVQILADQSWNGLDADVSKIVNADITFGSYQNDKKEDVFYTLNVKDINMGTAYAKAVEAAIVAGGNVKLGADVALTEKLSIAAGKELNLDMNGKTLTWNNTSGSAAYALNNKGKLTLTNGTIITNGTGANFAPCLYTDGEAILNNCTMISKNSNAVKLSGAGKLTINGGRYVSENPTGQAVRVGEWQDGKAAAWQLTIDGGKFEGTWAGLYIVNNYVGLAAAGKANIKNATFKGNTSVVHSGVKGSDIVFDKVKDVTIEACTLETKSIHSETAVESVINKVSVKKIDDVYSELFPAK